MYFARDDETTLYIVCIDSVCRDCSGNSYLLERIPPQITAFALSAAQKKPVVFTDEDGNDEIKVRQIIPITIAIDYSKRFLINRTIAKCRKAYLIQ